jgi:hypothetical protein
LTFPLDDSYALCQGLLETGLYRTDRVPLAISQDVEHLAVAITPAGLLELVRSYCPISGGHPDYTAGWLLR